MKAAFTRATLAQRSLLTLALAAALLIAPGQAQHPRQSEVDLQAAIRTQTVDGDLKAAIAQYAAIAQKYEKSDRATTAQALVHMAECYQKQGDAEAKKIYERVVREFGDQRQITAQARERLARMGVGAPARTDLQVRRLWAGEDVGGFVPFEICPAPDGRSVLFAHWDTGDAAVRDLSSGEIKRLGLKKSWSDSPDFVGDLVYSHDQRQFAYTWYDGKRYQMRIASMESVTKPRTLIDDPKIAFLKPFAWSLDGKSILIQIWKWSQAPTDAGLPGVRGETDYTQILWVSAADGSLKSIKTVDWREPQMISLSPDGRYIAFDALEQRDGIDRDIFIVRADGSDETVAVQSPGIDKDPVWAPDGSHLVFTSSRSRNLGLYALRVDGGKPQGSPRLVKAEIGPIALRGFVRGLLYYLQPNGEQNVFRTELDLQSGKARGAPVALGSTYLANNGMAALSPDGKRVAYLATGALGVPPSLIGGRLAGVLPSVIVKSLDGGMERTYTTDLMLNWAPLWVPGGKELLISGRREIARTGQAFFRLDLDSGQITRLLENGVNWQQPGSARGQRDLSRDGKTVYLAVSNWGPPGAATPGGGVATVNLSSGETHRIYQAEGNVQTQAVALSPDNRNLAVTTRNVGKPGTSLLVMGADGSRPQTLFESDDLTAVAGVAWSSNGNDVLFVRSVPGSDSQLWQIPAKGGEPSPTGIHGPGLREIQSGADGAIVFTAGSPKQAELWAMDNLLPILKSSQ